jgi:hypothetical protein
LSGENGSLTWASQKADAKRDDMFAYEKRVGLPKLPDQYHECKHLELTGETISKFSPEQCIEAATELSSYGVFIQRTLSKEKGMLRWLNSRIDQSIAQDIQEYIGYYSHEQRRAMAIVNNESAKALEELRLNSQLKVDMLEGLTFQINQLCRVLLESNSQKRYSVKT